MKINSLKFKNFSKLRSCVVCLLYFCPWTSLLGVDIPEKPVVVIVTSYNNTYWVKKNLQSIFKQDYSNYRIIYINDASEDTTENIIRQYFHNFHSKIPFTLISNRVRVGALENIYHAVLSCRDEEIIVSLDGDDWFYDQNVLKKINSAYSSRNIWLTHGTLSHFPGNALGWSIPIPDEIVAANAFRQYRCPSHLRTFYAWLFKKIDTEDLKYLGKFFSMTWDQAIMFPMIEMAGERHAFIPDILYVYNIASPINDNKVNAELQKELEVYIRSKSPYTRLTDIPNTETILTN